MPLYFVKTSLSVLCIFAVDIAAKTATAGEVQAVIDKYDGDVTVADNSGDFPI